MIQIKLGDLFLKKGGSVDPAKYSAETFEYYSIPSYDTGTPEIIEGSKIGSSKKIFQPNDVLLSRIVPHIRRCWIVGLNQGYRQIGSGEWIVFRSEKIIPQYLRFYLMSDEFNRKFLKTVKGVGGSLLRADPQQVAKFNIKIPPLPQQKKIAAILDAADKNRQLTKALIAKYDELTQSLFLDMFGDPVKNEKGWKKLSFEEMVHFDTTMTSDFEKYGDYPHIGIGNIEKDTGKILSYQTAKEEGITSGKYLFDERHIIYSKIRPNLNKVALPYFKGLCSADSYPLLPVSGVSNRIFIAFLLRSESFLDFILQHSTRTNIPKANKEQMRMFVGICPPLTLQNQFAERVQAIETQKAQAQASLEKAEELFNSLLQRAFKGELV